MKAAIRRWVRRCLHTGTRQLTGRGGGGRSELDRQEAIAASWHQRMTERRSELEVPDDVTRFDLIRHHPYLRQ